MSLRSTSLRLLSVSLFAASLLSASLFAAGPPVHGAEPAPASARDRGLSFRYDVLPALSKQGCSAGACHGSPSGKGGFRLSLRGYDPEFDRLTLIREDWGRRTNPVEPAQSLLLLKPLMQLSHGGGKQLRRADRAYAILHAWIARGCPDDPAAAPRCRRIEVSPDGGRWDWAEDAKLRLTVRAEFSDGTTRDVTDLTVFSSSHPEVLSVDATGLVVPQRAGEATIVARYLDFLDTAELQFLKTAGELTAAFPPTNNRIDQIVFPRLRELQIPPSPICEDHEFLRRVFLDVLGVLPTVEEATAFTADPRPDKRARLIDTLLERPEYAEFWAQHWADLLRVKSSKLGLEGLHKFHRWLTRAVAADLPYDQLARQLLTAQGSTLVNPAANYFRAAADPNDCAETTSQLFLGIRIQCARCHNHPFDRWSQDDYYGMGAFFGQLQRTATPRQGELFVWRDTGGEVLHPRTSRPARPSLPTAGPVAVAPEQDPRKVLAQWLTAPANPFFAKVGVNRIWGQLLGRGIVEPVDDFRADNPPAHPELLDYLAGQFAAGGFRQRRVIREILNSHVYQLSSKTLSANADDERYFSHGYTRLLRAEPLLDAICRVTGVAETYPTLPAGTRATALPSPEFGSDFLKVFGQPNRNTACECERGDDARLAQALKLINGELIARKLRDPRGRLSRLLDDLPARLRSAGEPPQGGLIAWFRGDAGAQSAGGTAPGEGAPVAQWTNQASPNQSLSQAEPQSRPHWRGDALGGLPALAFDGRDDFLHHATLRLLPEGAPRTIVVVGQATDNDGGALVTFGRQRTGGASIFTAQHVLVAGGYYLYSDGVNGAGNCQLAEPATVAVAELQRPFLTTFTAPGAGHKLQVFLNGRALPATQPGAIGRDQGSPGFTLAGREDLPLGDQLWGGLISEVLIYNRALDDQDRDRVGRYLTTKYALQASYRKYPRATPAGDQPGDRQILETFYLTALSRPPTDREVAVALRYLAESPSRRRGWEDLVWGLLNSTEFLCQH